MFLGSRSPAILSQPCGKLYGVLSHTVTVVGIGADGWAGLPPRSRAAIEQAGVLIGGPRQLALLPEGVTGRRVPLPSPLLPGLPELIAAHAGSALVVLASGDPMFYGIGSTLARVLGAARLDVLTHPSSVSVAAARLGWPLDDVDVVSLVGRPRELLHPLLQPGRRVLVLTAETTAAADIRALLDARGFGTSPVTVLADLGSDQEVVGPANGRPHSRLAIIAIDCRLDGAAAPLPRVPGLPDDAFEQDGQITKHEIRALALAALAPVPGQLLWDVGAGWAASASNGCASTRPAGPSRSSRAPTAGTASPATPPRSACRAWSWCPARPRRRCPGCPARTRCSSAAASPPTAWCPPAGTRCPRAAGWSPTRSPSRGRAPWPSGGTASAAP